MRQEQERCGTHTCQSTATQATPAKAQVRRFLKASGGRLPYCGQKRGYLHGYRYTEGAVRPDSFQRIVKGTARASAVMATHARWHPSVVAGNPNK